jgi:hypothetical protein
LWPMNKRPNKRLNKIRSLFVESDCLRTVTQARVALALVIVHVVRPRGYKLSKQDLNRDTLSLALNGILKALIHERRRQVLRGVRGDNMKRGTMQNFLSNLTRPMPGQES